MSKKQHPNNIQYVLNRANRKLGYILNKSTLLAQLNEALKAVLEPPLDQHCQVANVNDGCLIIATHSATWATQIHYLQQELLFHLMNTQAFQQVRPRITKIKCQVSRAIAEPRPRPKRPPNRLSPENAQNLIEFSQFIEDEALQNALKNLARWKK